MNIFKIFILAILMLPTLSHSSEFNTYFDLSHEDKRLVEIKVKESLILYQRAISNFLQEILKREPSFNLNTPLYLEPLIDKHGDQIAVLVKPKVFDDIEWAMILFGHGNSASELYGIIQRIGAIIQAINQIENNLNRPQYLKIARESFHEKADLEVWLRENKLHFVIVNSFLPKDVVCGGLAIKINELNDDIWNYRQYCD